MMTEVKKSSQSLGIISLVVGILAFVFAIVPCLGVIAIVPAIIAIVLPIVGLPHANREDSPRGMLISGLIIGIVATMISLSQIYVFTRLSDHSNNWPDQIEALIEEIEEKITTEFGDSDFSIRVESGEETVTIDGTINSNRDDVLEKLEELEALEGLEGLEGLDALEALDSL